MAITISRTYYAPPSATTSHSFNVSLPVGTNRKVVVTLGFEASPSTISALTFDGTSFLSNVAVTLTHSTDSSVREAQYYYDVPDIKADGTYAIAYTSGLSSVKVQAVADILVGAATGAPESTGSQEQPDGVAAMTASVTATDGAALIAGGVSAFTSPTMTWSGDVTERFENSGGETYRVGWADNVTSGAGSKSATCTLSSTVSGVKVIVLGSYAAAAPAGPTITVQPVADTVILSNETSASFSVTATGTGTLLYDWELETSVGGGVYANLANGNGATWTGQTAASCSATLTAKTLTGRRVRCNVTDDNGTTTTNAVALTIWDGPQVTTFPATDGSGESTATLTSDYVTGVGEAIEVRIPLSDGDVAVTVTTT